eukprot:CAMPEP_0194280612 /NCGR_PEP_ID=MMETSP0169-20130528/18019_1 /TAXON_ID=218684 /ORGANISM="Corethron pennatum, Strain L29A3" /LENGTH=276 /DNA_ID=CAMNT_0039025393 /DNA_START=106 /DNA_END=936 /DNA_ORIENTATION=-
MRITHKTTAVITGGANGIGLALSRHIVEKGGRVLVLDIVDSKVQSCAMESLISPGPLVGSAHYLQFDVTSDLAGHEKMWERALEILRTDRIDLMVNNAGVLEHKGFYSNEPESAKVLQERSREFDRVMEINVLGVIRGTKVAMARMRDQGGGLIINVASSAGLYPMDAAPVYSASKFAVVGFSRSVAKAAAVSNVRIFTICPGFADTALGQAALNDPTTKSLVVQVGGLMPVDRVVMGFKKIFKDDEDSAALEGTGGVLRVNNLKFRYEYPRRGKL